MKISVIALSLVMLFTLGGCGSEPGPLTCAFSIEVATTDYNSCIETQVIYTAESGVTYCPDTSASATASCQSRISGYDTLDEPTCVIGESCDPEGYTSMCVSELSDAGGARATMTTYRSAISCLSAEDLCSSVDTFTCLEGDDESMSRASDAESQSDAGSADELTRGDAGGDEAGPTDSAEPTDPEPTDPEPTDPEPTDPEPTDPEPTGANCNETYTCVANCGPDQTCVSACVEAGSTEAQGLFNAFIMCQQNQSCADAFCIATHCSTEGASCFYETSGDGTCSSFFECSQACMTGDSACIEACVAQTSAEGQAQLLAINICVGAECPQSDPDCVNASVSEGGMCKAFWDACM